MKTIKLKEQQTIYVRSMGKALPITAIAQSDDDANNYCEKHPDEGVIAVFGNLVFIANLYSRGLKVK